MDMQIINAKTRTATGKSFAKKLRATGRLPAVMYNEKGEATMLDIDEKEFNSVWRTITSTTLVCLKVDDNNSFDAFIQDTEYNILKDRVLHVDFFVPQADKPMSAKYKIAYSGNSAGVLKGGFMLKHLPEVQVKAVPKKIPAKIVADISKLEIGDVLRVKDLQLGEGVSLVTDGEAPLVSIKQAH